MREPVQAGDGPSACGSQSWPQPRPALPPLESRCLSKQAVPAKAYIFYLGSCVPTMRETLDMSENIPAGGRIIRKRFHFPLKCISCSPLPGSGRSPGGGDREAAGSGGPPAFPPLPTLPLSCPSTSWPAGVPLPLAGVIGPTLGPTVSHAC